MDQTYHHDSTCSAALINYISKAALIILIVLPYVRVSLYYLFFEVNVILLHVLNYFNTFMINSWAYIMLSLVSKFVNEYKVVVYFFFQK